MAISLGRRTLRFLGLLWLQSLKRAIWIAVIGVTISGIRLSLSQSGNGSGMMSEDMENSSNMSIPQCPRDVACSKLPPRCLNCSYSESCTYGNETKVMCRPLEGVQCDREGDRDEFSIYFNCRFCYQLNQSNITCTNNSDCNIRASPISLYTANCSANEDVFCIPPRNFLMQRRCNYSTGKRWTTAFLLSFTLGGFGVDRFYLNHWASACGKIITFGGLGVWSILDVILIGTGYLGPADGSAYIY